MLNKIIAFSIISLFFMSFSLAHETDTPHDEPVSDIELAKQMREESTNSWASMMPWTYFGQGDWIKGIIFIFIWFGLIYGFYTLVMLVLGRLVYSQ